jgi:hypothetical protein
MVRMSTSPSKHATALYAFLEKEWAAMKIAPTTWCRQVGIADPTVYRWSQGVEPDMKSIRRVAEALGRPVIDVLVAAGYVSAEEAGGHVPAPRSYSLIDGLNLDTTYSPEIREALRQVLDAMLLVETGAAKKVKVRTRRSVSTKR